jgi:hypothetical protein
MGGVYSLIGKEKAERAKAKAKDETTRRQENGDK